MNRAPGPADQAPARERGTHRRTTRLGLLVALALGSSACGPDFSAHDPAEDGETIVRSLHFVTVRDETQDSDLGKRFGDGRGPVRAGTVTVSWRPNALLEALSQTLDHDVRESSRSNGSTAVEAVDEIDQQSFWREVAAYEGTARPVLYIHGFKIDFEGGCKRAAQFQENLGLQGRFLWFTWPADGAALNYTLDETDLLWSVPFLSDVLDRLGETFGDGGFDVVAHSLGTRGAVQALLRRAAAAESRPPRVNQLVLAAPDMDAGIFHEDVQHLLPLVNHVTIYASADDAALLLSEKVHGYPRLGQFGPHLEGLDGVEIIDASQVDLRHPSGHVYHLFHPSVIEDLDQLLNGGKNAAERSGLLRADGYWRLEDTSE